MTQTRDPSLVIAYYRNPKTGRTKRHQMQSVIFEEASRGMMVGADWVTSEDNKNWSLDPPDDIDPRDILDLTPQPFVAVTPPAQPPPAYPARSPDPLRHAAPSTSSGPAPAPTRRRG